jgi:hypothetical protein
MAMGFRGWLNATTAACSLHVAIHNTGNTETVHEDDLPEVHFTLERQAGSYAVTIAKT